MPKNSPLVKISTTEARDRLTALIDHVQKPRSAVVLTKHNRSVAALVSMAELDRIYKQHEMEDIIHRGKRPGIFTFGRGFRFNSNVEAAEHIQRVQLDRRMEREVLAKAGLDVVPGGEIVEDLGEPAQPRRKWRLW